MATEKSLAAKLKEAIDTITHTHVGWKAESNAWRAVREVITALESSESLTALKEAFEELDLIDFQHDLTNAVVAARVKRVKNTVLKLIEEREQASK